MKQALVLFAHGSRDAEWSQPFERIASSLEKKLPAFAVKTAYLEAMRPSLDEVLAALAAKKATHIRIVPVFLGQGGHLKNDLPKLVAAAAEAYPGIEIALDAAIGEQPPVVAAIAEAIAASVTAKR